MVPDRDCSADAPSRSRIFVNGKFTAQAITGVQRVAGGFVCALDRLLAAAPASLPCPVTIVCPPQGRAPDLLAIKVRYAGPAGLPLPLWEQCVLPVVARSGRLLNLAGSAPWFGRPQTCLVHDAAVFDHPQAYQRAFVAWYRKLFRHQAAVGTDMLTVSEFSRSRLQFNLGPLIQTIRVLKPGADHFDGLTERDDFDAWFRAQSLDRQPYFLAVGSANPGKNLARLMVAYDRLPNPRPALVVVGGGHSRVFGAGGESSSGDPVGVRRVGQLDDRLLIGLYRRALGLVFPSLYEGFGLPPLEAMGQGCPVIVSNVASLPEVCGDAALAVDPLDEGAMAGAMQRLINEPALRQALSDAGRRRVAECRWTDAGSQLLSHLRAAEPAL